MWLSVSEEDSGLADQKSWSWRKPPSERRDDAADRLARVGTLSKALNVLTEVILDLDIVGDTYRAQMPFFRAWACTCICVPVTATVPLSKTERLTAERCAHSQRVCWRLTPCVPSKFMG